MTSSSAASDNDSEIFAKAGVSRGPPAASEAKIVALVAPGSILLILISASSYICTRSKWR